MLLNTRSSRCTRKDLPPPTHTTVSRSLVTMLILLECIQMLSVPLKPSGRICHFVGLGGHQSPREDVGLWTGSQTFEISLGSKGSPLRQRSPTFLAPGSGFVEDKFSMDWLGRGWSWGRGWFRAQAVTRAMGSDGERWGAADEASLVRPLLTSCWAAQFLTDLRPLLVRSPGVGDPCLKTLLS